MTRPNMLGSETLKEGMCTNYEGTRGPQVKHKWALPKSGSIRVRCVAWHKKVQRKKVIMRKMKKLWQKRRCKLWKKKSEGS